MYVYVHISLFLSECACTKIIDISPRIFRLIYCCVSIIIVICICPPGALIWLINLFLFLFLSSYQSSDVGLILIDCVLQCLSSEQYIAIVYSWIHVYRLNDIDLINPLFKLSTWLGSIFFWFKLRVTEKMCINITK